MESGRWLCNLPESFEPEEHNNKTRQTYYYTLPPTPAPDTSTVGHPSRRHMDPSISISSAGKAAAPAAPAPKAQPWKSHWPPKSIDTSAPYGFKKGDTIINSGN
ncbi:hypothetical protein AC578_955 [Pseudocercospora eumusae]|uniref:Uncharacterized protein n=1 Tax=Pseudocercospora eumusae TaxID=321146 RepID=A0A139HEK8_9PEZI|nr:hypothetical protein AC578_955 [Pseudocercospora eumusae]